MSKKEILEDAATEITAESCHTMYPDDIEKFYEDGMSAEELTKKVLNVLQRETIGVSS